MRQEQRKLKENLFLSTFMIYFKSIELPVSALNKVTALFKWLDPESIFLD